MLLYKPDNILPVNYQVQILRKIFQLKSGVFFFFALFCCFTSQVNSYGHGGTVNSFYHTFSWASLNKQLTSTTTLLE